jgi:(p)ppGpp synthase/HD superfamily hydrolase
VSAQPTPLGTRFSEALAYATDTHRAQARKGTTIPYVAHLLAVAALVLEDGGDEDLAIAALLHDAAEDQGGETRLADIERRFGSRVSGIVKELSDTTEFPKPPWRGRKAAHLAHLAHASDDAVRVALADKLHNLRAIVTDYCMHGDALWERFDPDADQLWYYRSLIDVLGSRRPGPMADELAHSLRELEELVDSGPYPEK